MSNNLDAPHIPNDESDLTSYTITSCYGTDATEQDYSSDDSLASKDLLEAQPWAHKGKYQKLLIWEWWVYKLNRSAWKEFVIAFLFCYLSIFVMTFFMNFVHMRMPDPEQNQPLPDIIHDLFPLVDTKGHSEMLMGINQVMTFGVGLIYYKFEWFPLGTRYMIAWAFVWYLRTIAMLATNLPPTSEFCRKDYDRGGIGNVYWNTLIGVLSFGASNVHCGDLLFSGHTTSVALNWLWMLTYMSDSYFWVTMSTLISVGKMVLIVLERHHYTIDVLASLYVSVTCWRMCNEKLPVWVQKCYAWICRHLCCKCCCACIMPKEVARERRKAKRMSEAQEQAAKELTPTPQNVEMGLSDAVRPQQEIHAAV